MIILIIIISEFNSCKLTPTNLEKKFITEEFKNIEINNKNQLFEVQNKVISQIKHYPLSNKTIDVLQILKLKKGLCYDRSMLLQKIMLINKLPVIPVYLYFNPSKKTTFLDLFSSNTQSHSLFFVLLKGDWILVQTNYKQVKLYKNLDEYISVNKFIPKHSKYVLFLSNRNGRFIFPNIIPDLYLAH